MQEKAAFVQQTMHAGQGTGGLHAGGLPLQRALEVASVLKRDTEVSLVEFAEASAAVPHIVYMQ